MKQIELYGEHEYAKDEYIELQEEVKLLKCLKHDNIIRYYGTCLQDNSVNIFMEFVGKKLGNPWRDGTGDPPGVHLGSIWGPPGVQVS